MKKENDCVNWIVFLKYWTDIEKTWKDFIGVEYSVTIFETDHFICIVRGVNKANFMWSFCDVMWDDGEVEY